MSPGVNLFLKKKKRNELYKLKINKINVWRKKNGHEYTNNFIGHV